ncbi:MAG: hypothetical protein KBB86_00945, partial [Candidatus Pacebacteria bacterium]|nr:hypothetical protein [Candidatus Paceibacterota bacterium]
DGFNLAVWKDYIIMGGVTGTTTAMLTYSQGANGSVTSISTTAGNVNGFESSVEQVSSIVSFGGTYYYSTGKTDSSSINVGRVNATGSNTATYTTRANESSNSGKIITADTANVDASILGVYNGRIYAGSVTGAGTAAIYELVDKQDWELVNTTRGTFGGETGIDAVSAMIEYNGQMFIGTDDGANGVASVYSWSKTSSDSYGLQFDSGSSNYGKISFKLSPQANTEKYSGAFNFSHSVNMQSNAFDYAEDYPTYDTSLKPGDVVMIDPDNVDFIKRADGTNPAIGIYSLNPGLRLQKSKDTPDMGGEVWVPIALVGRVPVKVSTENGIIMPGDSLMLSHTLPGVAMKATKSGAIIAQALEGYSGADVGQVSVFINNSYGSGSSFDKILNPVEQVDAVTGAITMTNPTYGSKALLEQLLKNRKWLLQSVNLSDIFADRIAAGLEIVTPLITTDTVATNTINSASGSDINVALEGSELLNIGSVTEITNDDGTVTKTVNKNISFDKNGNAVFVGKITADSIEAGNITGMDAIVNKISLLSNGQEAITLTATAVDALNQALVALGADVTNISTKINVIESSLADLKTTQDLMAETQNIQGLRMKVIEELLASNTLSSDMVINKLTVNNESVFNGTVKFGAQTEFAVPPLFNNNTAGFAVVKNGTRKVDVVFENPYIAQPVVNATISFEDGGDVTKNMTDLQVDEFFNKDIKFVITNKTQNGFSIRLNKIANEDIKFSWSALQVKDVKVFESVIPGLVIDLPVTISNLPETDAGLPDAEIQPDPALDNSPAIEPGVITEPEVIVEPMANPEVDLSAQEITPEPEVVVNQVVDVPVVSEPVASDPVATPPVD